MLMHKWQIDFWDQICCYSKFLVKVARVVMIKLGFMDSFSYNLIILINQWEIPFKNFDKALLFSKNQYFVSKIDRVATCPGIPGNPGKVLDFFLSEKNP